MDKLIEFISKDWNESGIVIIYKRAHFRLDTEDLTDENKVLLKKYSADKYNINGSGILKGKDIDLKSLHFNFNNYGIPKLLIDHKVIEIDYIDYKYFNNTQKILSVQKSGFLVYCAPTGQGKTYFAITNLPWLERQFDTILYINFELSIDDIKNRCIKREIPIPKNLYVAPIDNVDIIENWAADKGSCAFIIDNIDNLVGGGNDAYGAQLDFIKKLDRFLKDYNHHALVLTQLVKENNMNLLGKDGEINDGITTNILSGVKQLSYLSRTVMMTAYSPELQHYVYKILKVGSAKNA